MIALRARFVGGRPSPFCSVGGGDVLERTLPVEGFAALWSFGRGPVGEVDAALSSCCIATVARWTDQIVGSNQSNNQQQKIRKENELVAVARRW